MIPTPTTMRLPQWLESAWLARYLDRELSVEEAAWFEAYLLDKPELLAMVEADNALRDGVAGTEPDWRSFEVADQVEGEAQARSNGAVAAAGVAGDRSSGGAPAVVRPRRSGLAGLALAASLLLGIALGWTGFGWHGAENPSDGVIANPTRVVFDTMRGKQEPPRREHGATKSPYLFIEVAVPPGAQNIRMRSADGRKRELQASPDGFVSFLVARTQMAGETPIDIDYAIGGNEMTRTITRNQLEEMAQ